MMFITAVLLSSVACLVSARPVESENRFCNRPTEASREWCNIQHASILMINNLTRANLSYPASPFFKDAAFLKTCRLIEVYYLIHAQESQEGGLTATNEALKEDLKATITDHCQQIRNSSSVELNCAAGFGAVTPSDNSLQYHCLITLRTITDKYAAAGLFL